MRNLFIKYLIFLFLTTNIMSCKSVKNNSNIEFRYFDIQIIEYITNKKLKNWKPNKVDELILNSLMDQLIKDNELDFINYVEFKDKLLVRLVFYIENEKKSLNYFLVKNLNNLLKTMIFL
jgi:hypothetical protein